MQALRQAIGKDKGIKIEEKDLSGLGRSHKPANISKGQEIWLLDPDIVE